MVKQNIILKIIIGILSSLIVIVFYKPHLVIKTPKESNRKAINQKYYERRKSLFEILPQKSSDIIFLGNSITNGAEISELFNDYRIKNRGINADTIDGLLGRLGIVATGKPDKIFILIGTNDIKYDSITDIIIKYKHLLTELKIISSKSKLYVQSLPPVINSELRQNQTIFLLNEKLKNLCVKENVTFIDINSSLLDKSGELSSEFTNDGVHLNGKGYANWKSIIIEYL